jgi:AraC family transcriptional regulator
MLICEMSLKTYNKYPIYTALIATFKKMVLEKVQHIVKFVEDNYYRNIPINELEDIGCYSYRNLQRIFQNIFKETIGAFQKRLKLEKLTKC